MGKSRARGRGQVQVFGLHLVRLRCGSGRKLDQTPVTLLRTGAWERTGPVRNGGGKENGATRPRSLCSRRSLLCYVPNSGRRLPSWF